MRLNHKAKKREKKKKVGCLGMQVENHGKEHRQSYLKGKGQGQESQGHAPIPQPRQPRSLGCSSSHRRQLRRHPSDAFPGPFATGDRQLSVEQTWLCSRCIQNCQSRDRRAASTGTSNKCNAEHPKSGTSTSIPPPDSNQLWTVDPCRFKVPGPSFPACRPLSVPQ